MNNLIDDINLVGLDPTKDAVDRGDYRLYSASRVLIECSGDRLVSAGLEWGDSRMGAEPSDSTSSWLKKVVYGLEGHLEANPSGVKNFHFISNGGAVFLSWWYGGSPDKAGLERANKVMPRSSTVIWHQPALMWKCRDSKAILCGYSLVGSAFPTHMLWHDSVLIETIEQSSIKSLWKSDPQNPELVVSGERREGPR